MEEKSGRRTRRNELKKLILESVKVTGLVTVALVAPNVIGAMAKIGIIRSSRQREVIVRSCDRLISLGLLTRNEAGLLRLTSKGEVAMRRLSSGVFKARPRRWDGKWRVLIFDIPEYRRKTRDDLRRSLHHIGFVPLQQSVWVYPYDCEDFITLMKADFHIGNAMLYMIVDSIENDKHLRQHFELAHGR